MDGYNHYIRTDANGIVIHGFTDGFEQPQPGDSLIIQYGPRQFQYELINDRGQYIYKVVNGAMVNRTQSELDAEWNARPSAAPSQEIRIASLEAALLSIMGL